MKTSKASNQARDTQVIAASRRTSRAPRRSRSVGSTYKAKEIQSLLQSRIDAASATATSRAAWATAVATEQEKTTECESVLLALKSHLLTTYGAKSQIVADFGFTPKQRQTTAETTALAVEKREATRAARGTIGKKAKLKIKGVVAPATSSAPQAVTAPPPTNGATPAVPSGH